MPDSIRQSQNKKPQGKPARKKQLSYKSDFANQEKREKTSKREKTGDVEEINRNFQKKFEKSIDKPKYPCYNNKAENLFLPLHSGKTRIFIYIKTEDMQMSTFMANKNTVDRKWYIIDAAGVPLGKTAAKAANILRGKHRAEFTPHVDCGEFVIIINADKAVLTGKKLEQKKYYHHSGYIGGLKEVSYKTLMATKPELAMQLAVKGMLPKNSIGRKSITRLKVYSGSEHKHQAQKPVALD